LRSLTAKNAQAHTGLDAGYKPFPGIVLTDTFQLGETGEGTGTWDVFPVNTNAADEAEGP